VRSILVAAMAWWGIAAGCLSAAEPIVEDVVLGVHGGFGPGRKELKPDEEKAYRSTFEQALRAGRDAMNKPDGTSLDGVEAAIRVLEDSPLFNAGKGAVFTRDGKNEMDASMMEGKSLRAGAVAGVTIIKNPISAARVVMERTPHVLFVGRGAELVATREGLEIVDPSYFWTERQWKKLQERIREEQKKSGAASDVDRPRPLHRTEWGTVGAVARDKHGNLAAGTSTGGTSWKMSGRVGDSPIIGAGTYADNEGGAVSATGHGEYFIRFAVAHDIVVRAKYRGTALPQAADEVLLGRLKPAGGEGGVIVLSPKGQYCSSSNTDGMYRACILSDGKVRIVLDTE